MRQASIRAAFVCEAFTHDSFWLPIRQQAAQVGMHRVLLASKNSMVSAEVVITGLGAPHAILLDAFPYADGSSGRLCNRGRPTGFLLLGGFEACEA